jgi:hypothetical protein
MAKTFEILSAIDTIIPRIAGTIGVITSLVSIGVAFYQGLRDRFAAADPEKDWTPDEINAEADAMIAGIHSRDDEFSDAAVEEETD